MIPTIRVKVGEGRECPMHANDYAAPGGGHTILRATDGVVEVRDSVDVRKRLRAGDLVIVAPDAKAVPK
jgi:hypothetical protein